MAFSNPITGGQGALVRPAIKSPDYAPGSLGWSINRDGSAEFNNLTVRGVFAGTDFVINSSGEFFYSGTPAAGNLVASITAVAGTDAYGNHYLAGFTVYSSTAFAQMNSGLLEIGTVTGGVPDQADAAKFSASASDTTIVSVADAAGGLPSPATMVLLPGVAVSLPNGTEPAMVLRGANFPNSMSLWINGAVVKADQSGVPVTWQSVTYTANFAAASTAGSYQDLHYRIDAEDNLHIEGSFHSLAGTTNAQVFTLPVGYRPSIARSLPVVSDNAAGTVQTMNCLFLINANGPCVLRTSALTAVSQNYYVNAKVPLGNIP